MQSGPSKRTQEGYQRPRTDCKSNCKRLLAIGLRVEAFDRVREFIKTVQTFVLIALCNSLSFSVCMLLNFSEHSVKPRHPEHLVLSFYFCLNIVFEVQKLVLGDAYKHLNWFKWFKRFLQPNRPKSHLAKRVNLVLKTKFREKPWAIIKI